MNTIIMISRADLDDAISSAARLAAEEAIRSIPKDRPEHVNYTEAGKLLRVSRQTVANYVRAGLVRLNACGRIPIDEIDRLLKRGASSAA